MTDAVAGLLDWVDRRAAESEARAAAEAETAETQTPVKRGPTRGLDLGPTAADDEDAWDEAEDLGVGPAGIGAPILPKGRGRG